MRTILIISLAALATGCSTLNRYGIGGKPELQCSWRTAEAVINDRIVGTKDAQAQLSVVRRFEDGDVLCTELLKARAVQEAYRELLKMQAEQLREAVGPEKSEKPGL